MAVKKAKAKAKTSKGSGKSSKKSKSKSSVKKAKTLKKAGKLTVVNTKKKASKNKKLLKAISKNSSGKPVVLKAIKTNLTARELEYFKNLILEEKKEILENARRLRESLVDENTGEYVGDHSTFSMHMAEQGSDEMEREKAFMFIQRDEKYLGYLEEALDKISKKVYGVCVECMYEPKELCKTCPFIPKERLEVVPITQHCLECKMAKSS
jgi:DnaK suppressor protein